MKKKLIVILVLLIAVFFVRRMYLNSITPQEVVISEAVEAIVEDNKSKELALPQDEDVKSNSTGEEQKKVEKSSKKLTIPAKVQLDLPFIVQAPFAEWEVPYKEACEEASILTVHRYYQGDEQLTQQEMKDFIDEIIPWGDKTFGSFDSSAQATSRYLTDYFNYDTGRVRTVYDITIDDIKAVLAQGYPVIVPAAGRELGNKYFRSPGPLYHMLVITGYDNDEFITNDPGTSRGEGYRYDQEILYNAIHDLTDDLERITEGRKVMIVVK